MRNENAILRIGCVLESRLLEYVTTHDLPLLDDDGRVLKYRKADPPLKVLINSVKKHLDGETAALTSLREARNNIAHDNPRTTTSDGDVSGACDAVERALVKLGVLPPCPQITKVEPRCQSTSDGRRVTFQIAFLCDGQPYCDYQWEYVYS